MKKMLTLLLVIGLLISAFPVMAIADTDVDLNMAEWPILVDGVKIETAKAFQTDDGTLMVPLRAIAEALGFEVEWDATARAVAVGEKVTLTIGESSSVIVDNLTYVPLGFFRDTLKMPNAFAFEGQIEIHSTGETME